jgi:hypothetical protein
VQRERALQRRSLRQAPSVVVRDAGIDIEHLPERETQRRPVVRFRDDEIFRPLGSSMVMASHRTAGCRPRGF